MRSPVIVQASVKTVRELGRVLSALALPGAGIGRRDPGGAPPRPLPRPRRGHRGAAGRVRLAAVRRLGPLLRGGARRDARGRGRGPPLRRRGGERDRGDHAGWRTTSARRRRESATPSSGWPASSPRPGSTCSLRPSGRRTADTRLLPRLSAGADQRPGRGHRDSPGPARRHRLTADDFRDLVGRGLRQGERLHGDQGGLPEGGPGPPAPGPCQQSHWDPPRFFGEAEAAVAEAARRHIIAFGARRGRPVEPGADLRLRRCPRRHRAGRAPGGVQSPLRRAGPGLGVVAGGVRPAAADRRRQGAAAGALRRRGLGGPPRPAPRSPGGRNGWWPAGTAARPSIFLDLVAAGRPARRGRGSPAWPAEAQAAGWQTAVASTAADQSVRSIVDHVLPAEVAARRAGVRRRCRARARSRRPTSTCWRWRSWAGCPGEVCVVEDSGQGLLAARRAGCAALITVSDFTAGDDFTGAALVVDSLGNASHPARVLAAAISPLPGPLVGLDTCEAVISWGAAGGAVGDHGGEP